MAGGPRANGKSLDALQSFLRGERLLESLRGASLSLGLATLATEPLKGGPPRTSGYAPRPRRGMFEIAKEMGKGAGNTKTA